MKKLVILLPLLLAGCASTDPNYITQEYKIVQAPEELYYCPTVGKFPDAKTLTDRQVGILLLKYHRNNRICKNNMESLKQFYDNANQITQPEESPGFFSYWFK